VFAPLHARTGTGGGVPKHADLYITTAGEIKADVWDGPVALLFGFITFFA